MDAPVRPASMQEATAAGALHQTALAPLQAQTQVAAQLVRDASDSSHTLVRLPDGEDIAVRVSGAGRAVVCIHGWAADSRVFAPVAYALADRHCVVRIDLRGHGRSRGSGAYTLDAAAGDVAHVLAALDIRDAIAVGWSMGAMVLWRALALHETARARIAGLVVVDMAPKLAVAADWSLGLQLAEAQPERLIESMTRDWPSFAAGLAPGMLGDAAAPELIATCASMFAENDAQAMAAYWASMARTDCRPDVASLDVPMLAVYGAQSRLYAPQTAAWLAANAPIAEAVAFSNAGHAPHLEQPADFHDLLSSFAGAAEIADAPRRVLATVSAAATVGQGDTNPQPM